MAHRHLYRHGTLRSLLLGRRQGLRIRHPARRRRSGIATLGGIAALAALVIIGGLYWKLSQGPIQLDGLTPRVEAALNEAFDGKAAVNLGGIALERGGLTGLRVRAEDIVLRDGGGRSLGQVDEAELSLDPAALLVGQVQVRRMALVAPVIRVRRTGEGIDVVAGPRGAPMHESETAVARATPDALAVAAGAVDQVLRIVSSGAAELESLKISDAELDYADESGGRVMLPAFDMEVKRVSERPATLRIVAGTPEARITGVIRAWDEPGRREIEGELEGLRLGGLADPKPQYAAIARQPLGLSFSMPLTAEGKLAGGIARLRGDRLDLPVRPDRPFRGELRLRLEPEARRIVLEPSEIGVARGTARLVGAFVFGEADKDRVAVSLAADAVRLDHIDGAAPVDLHGVSLTGTGSLEKRSLDIERLQVDADRVRLSLAGRVAMGDLSPELHLQGEGAAADISAVKQVWPPFVAPGARQWVLENVEAGRLAQLRFRVDAERDALQRAENGEIMLPTDAMEVSIAFDGARFRAVDGLLPVERVKGTASGDGNAFTVGGEGQARLPSGRLVQIRSGRLDIANVHPVVPDGVVSIDFEAEAAGVVELLGLPPLDRLAKLPFTAADVSGRAEGHARLALPLRSGLAADDIRWQAEVGIADAGISALPEKRKLEKAQVTVRASTEGAEVTGKGILDGVPANIELKLDKAGRVSDDGTYAVSVLVDERTDERFGLELDNVTQGPVVARARGGIGGEGPTRIELDLTNARIVHPALGTLKPEGRKAQASFVLHEVPEGHQLRDFRLVGDGLQVRGTVNLTRDGSLASVELPEFRLGAGDQASLNARTQNGVLNVNLSGKSFDAGRVMRGLTAPGDTPAGGTGAVDLTVKLDRLVGLNGEEIRNASLRYAGKGSKITELGLSGRFVSGGAVNARTRAGAAGRQLTLVSQNAGALLRFVDLYSRVQDGVLELRVDIERPSPAGIVSVSEFRIVNEEGLRKLANSAGQASKPSEVDAASPTQPFQSLTVSFVKSGEAILLEEGRINGPFSGATFQGTIDRKSQTVDVNGTFVPIFLLNNIFANIPLFGPILGSRKGEGLVGVTFALRGPMNSPTLAVNPVSVAAPGVFRRFFEFGTSYRPQEPQAAPPQATPRQAPAN